MNKLTNLKTNKIFAELYKGKEEESLKRIEKAVDEFISIYGEGDYSIFSIPGRTEVMGNHTDHNFGKVLAASVDLDILAIARVNGTDFINAKSEGFSKEKLNIKDLEVSEKDRFTSCSIIRGMCDAMLENGYKIGGFDAYITSNVPGGSGLSSSAAYENTIGTILNYFFNDGKVGYIELGKMSQKAENKHFGKPCGLMDQIACASGGFVNIDFEDVKNPICKKLDLDLDSEGYKLCIIKTGGSHADLNDDYASVPSEMKAVAKVLGEEVLRRTSKEAIIENFAKLRKELGDRAILRALHFYDENERVDKAVEAITSKNVEKLLGLINESGTSSSMYLQNYFTCKMPSEQGITLAVALARSVVGEKGASRVHGGGFAGTAQAFVPNEKIDEFVATMESAFGKNCVNVLRIRSIGATKII